MQIVAMAVPAQEGITRDNVTRPGGRGGLLPGGGPDQGGRERAELHVRGLPAGADLAAVDHRPVRDGPAAVRAGRRSTGELRRIIDEPTEGPWGIRVERVEIKDVSLPESMKRSMSRQAEAERERRARIITADGEYQASKRLAAAANVMARDPAALQLRLLQTVVEVAAERNSTLVMPVPVELLRFFEKMAPRAAGRRSPPPRRRPTRRRGGGRPRRQIEHAARRSSIPRRRRCPSSPRPRSSPVPEAAARGRSPPQPTAPRGRVPAPVQGPRTKPDA